LRPGRSRSSSRTEVRAGFRVAAVDDRVRTSAYAIARGATAWLNSEPLGPAELRGHVVLVDFWTLTCINWLRTEPYVRAWSQTYRNDGLVVIGVHTPEFSFEHEIDRVRPALTARGIDYRSRSTTTTKSGTAFDNHYWPALYFVDADGIIRDDHFGEGRYEQSERVIQRLLASSASSFPSKDSAWRRRPTGNILRSPEDVSRLPAQASTSHHRTAPLLTNARALRTAHVAGFQPLGPRRSVDD